MKGGGEGVLKKKISDFLNVCSFTYFNNVNILFVGKYNTIKEQF